MNNKFLLGGIIGGVTCFIIGYLIYGLAIGSMLSEGTMAGVSKPMEQYNWALLIIGNLASGFLLSYILTKSGTLGFGGGAMMGAVVGLLMALSFDCIMYATSNMYTDLKTVIIDVIGYMVLMAVGAGAVGAYLGTGKKA
ncbi:MAG: hypothetical protein ABJC12_09090 [Saprospiraceae bacterium]